MLAKNKNERQIGFCSTFEEQLSHHMVIVIPLSQYQDMPGIHIMGCLNLAPDFERSMISDRYQYCKRNSNMGCNFTDSLRMIEQHIYGSARLGLLNTSINLQRTSVTASIIYNYRGFRNYELSNH